MNPIYSSNIRDERTDSSMKKFGIGKEGDSHTYKQWWSACKGKVPFVYISTRRKYASVRWDCYSLDRRYESRIPKDLCFTMMPQMLRGIPSCGSKEPEFFGSGREGSIDYVPKDDAPAVAEKLHDYLANVVGLHDEQPSQERKPR